MKRKLQISAALLVAAALLLSLVGCSRSQTPDADADALQAGLEFLAAQETKDPGTVDAVLKARREEALAKEREETLQKLYSGEIDVWSLFEDYVVLGDSRAVGFYYYDYLEESRTLADGGETIRNVALRMDSIKALNPSYIFLCFGLNDVSIGYWDTPAEYAAEFLEVVQDLNTQLPEATVVVSSILPAKDPAFERSSKWREIPEYSAAVEQMCQENGIIFVNNDQTAAEHMDLWDSDGIHLGKTFYPYWGANLIAAVLEHAGPEEGVTLPEQEETDEDADT